MTVAPDSPRLRFDTLEEAVGALRAQGLRLSTARRLVLQALFEAEGPVSAIHLARLLAIDESSVYRNLEVLESHGVIRHIHLGHGPGLYVLLGSEESEYLYCSRCSKVTALAPEQFDGVREQIRQATGYEAQFTHFAVVGLCETCAAENRSSSGRRGRTRARRGSETHGHGDFVHTHARGPGQTLDHEH